MTTSVNAANTVACRLSATVRFSVQPVAMSVGQGEAEPPGRAAASFRSIVAADSPAPKAGLKVVRTWWHPMAERREAEISLGAESRRVREGERVGDALVTRIEPSGVVFANEDEEFRRAVGE